MPRWRNELISAKIRWPKPGDPRYAVDSVLVQSEQRPQIVYWRRTNPGLYPSPLYSMSLCGHYYETAAYAQDVFRLNNASSAFVQSLTPFEEEFYYA